MPSGGDGHADGREDADRAADQRGQHDGPRSGVVSSQDHAGVHQAEQKENRLHERVPLVLEVMHRIVVGRVGQQVEPARLVRQERHDRDERERGMESFPEEREPRQRAADGQVGPEGPHLQRPHDAGEAERDEQERHAAAGGQPRMPCRDHKHAEQVRHNGKQQYERQHPAPRHDHFQHVVGGRNVDGAGNRPARCQDLFVPAEDVREVRAGASRDAAGRGNHRQRPSAPGVERAARHCRFDDLLHDEPDEEGHADLVHRKRERLREPEIRLRYGVGPRERDDDAEGQPEEPVHAVVNGVGRMVTVMALQLDVVRGGRVVPHFELLTSLAWRWMTPESTVIPVRATASKNSSSPATSTSMKALSWSK